MHEYSYKILDAGYGRRYETQSAKAVMEYKQGPKEIIQTLHFMKIFYFDDFSYRRFSEAM